MTHANGDSKRGPGAVTCVVIASLWAGLAVWFITSGQTWVGVGAGIPAAAWLVIAVRRRAGRPRPASEVPPAAGR